MLGDLFCIFTHWSNTIAIDLLKTEEVKGPKLMDWEGEMPWKVDKGQLIVDLPVT